MLHLVFGLGKLLAGVDYTGVVCHQLLHLHGATLATGLATLLHLAAIRGPPAAPSVPLFPSVPLWEVQAKRKVPPLWKVKVKRGPPPLI